MAIPTVTALKLRRSSVLHYETNLPAIQANTQTATRLPCADEDERRPRDTGPPAAAWAKALAPERRREALRPSYAGVIFRVASSPARKRFWIARTYPRFIKRQHVAALQS